MATKRAEVRGVSINSEIGASESGVAGSWITVVASATPGARGESLFERARRRSLGLGSVGDGVGVVLESSISSRGGRELSYSPEVGGDHSMFSCGARGESTPDRARRRSFADVSIATGC